MDLLNRLWAGFIAFEAGIALALVSNTGIVAGGENTAIKCVVEWEQVSAADAQMPPFTVSDLLAEFDKVAAAGKELRSWEARCRVTSQIDRGQSPAQPIAAVKDPEPVATTYSTLLVSSGKQWFSERRLGEWQDENVEYRRLCEGEQVQTVSPSQKVVDVRTWSEFAARENAQTNMPELPVGFPPFLETQRVHHFMVDESLPDVRKILADPDAKVLPWRTRVDGRVCYVVERTTITESPIFRSREDAEAWRKQNPGRRLFTVIKASAKPDDKRIDRETVRLAIDPESGFMPARWATGRAIILPGVNYVHFPVEEILCTNYRKLGSRGYIAGRFQYTHYSTDRRGNQKISARQEGVLRRIEEKAGAALARRSVAEQ